VSFRERVIKSFVKERRAKKEEILFSVARRELVVRKF